MEKNLAATWYISMGPGGSCSQDPINTMVWYSKYPSYIARPTWWVSALAIYCYVTNEPKTQLHKTIISLSSKILWVRNFQRAWWRQLLCFITSVVLAGITDRLRAREDWEERGHFHDGFIYVWCKAAKAKGCAHQDLYLAFLASSWTPYLVAQASKSKCSQ